MHTTRDDRASAITRGARRSLLRAIARSDHTFDVDQRAAIDRLSAGARHGFYLWGDVGRGKTLLAETYLASIPTERTRRFHFHEFFRALQTQIIRDRVPLETSVARLIGDAAAVLFDEFHVHDVADGVYLAATLRHLLAEDVFLIATSNYAPELLMPDPIFHDRFLPSIDLIRASFEVIHLQGNRDHRHNGRVGASGFRAGTWIVSTAAPDHPTATLEAAGLALPAVAVADTGAVLRFEDLCEQPLGVLQYLWLAEAFERVTLCGVPDLARVSRSALTRFSHLVEVFADRDARLDVASVAGPERLLAARVAPPEARRVASRLAMLRR